MSFFVSKSLENIVDEDCLIDDVSYEEFTAYFKNESEDLFLGINSIRLLDENKIELLCNSNLAVIEKLFVSCCIRSLKLKKKSFAVQDGRIIEINRAAQDSYKVRIICYSKKGE